jgi:lysophospholipase L1-like esterase
MAPRRLPAALLALALAALAPLLAAPARAADPPASAPIGPGDVYLALGDSLVTGDEAPANNDGQPGFPAYLHEVLSATRPISYTNLGVSGETSTSLRTPGGQLDRALGFIAQQQAAGRRVSPVTLSIGGNDMVGVLLNNTTTLTAALTLFRSNFEQTLDQLTAALTVNGARAGDIVVLRYYNPYPGLAAASPLPLNANPDTDVPKFNQVIEEVAAARGVAVADGYTPFLGRQADLTFVRFPYIFFPFLEANFDYHPREAGHRILARAFADATGYALKRPVLYLPVTRQ